MKGWVFALLAGADLVGYAEGYLVGEREARDATTEAHDEELGDAYRMGVAHGRNPQHLVGTNGG